MYFKGGESSDMNNLYLKSPSLFVHLHLKTECWLKGGSLGHDGLQSA